MADNIVTIDIPNRHRSSTKIASFSLSKTGQGNVIGVDGAEKATFRIERTGRKDSAALISIGLKFELNRVGAEALRSQCQVSRDRNGVISVDGDVDSVPFCVRVSSYGKRLKGTVPAKLKRENKQIITAMGKAFEQRANAHFDQAGCALAGLDVIVSAFTLNPIGVGFGFVGILVAC